MDYIDKLKDEEKEWLNTFMEEYANANFNHGKKQLHNTKSLKKDCYDRNNARNRDILTRNKAAGDMQYIEDLKKTEVKIKQFFEDSNGDESEEFSETDESSD